MEGIRLDLYLVENNFFASREKAKRAIESKQILINDKIVTKSSYVVKENDSVVVIESEYKFVSQGAFKLLRAIKEFKLDFKDKKVLDIGASTGGFTDCALQHGAKLVYALDVGSEQLHPSLKEDKRVISLENTNFRNVSKEVLNNEIFDFIVVDVSFISLRNIIPNIINFIDDNSIIITLVKPQFEAGKDKLNKKGVVTSKSAHISVLNDYHKFLLESGYNPINYTFSTKRGEKEGNIEFLALFKKGVCNKYFDFIKIVNEAHNYFKGSE